MFSKLPYFPFLGIFSVVRLLHWFPNLPFLGMIKRVFPYDLVTGKSEQDIMHATVERLGNSTENSLYEFYSIERPQQQQQQKGHNFEHLLAPLVRCRISFSSSVQSQQQFIHIPEIPVGVFATSKLGRDAYQSRDSPIVVLDYHKRIITDMLQDHVIGMHNCSTRHNTNINTLSNSFPFPFPFPFFLVSTLRSYSFCYTDRDMCIVGDKGSGKSTLVKFFCNLIGYQHENVEIIHLYKDMTARDLVQRSTLSPLFILISCSFAF